MITLRTRVRVDGVRGRDITDFLLAPSDAAYQRWWPGVHLLFHHHRAVPGHVGSVVYIDERIGDRRVTMEARVVEAVPGQRVVWQMSWGVALPAWLALDLEDDGAGVTVTHTLRAGFEGIGGVIDPALRLYFSRRFRAALDEHVRIEFRRLGELLRAEARDERASLDGASPKLRARVRGLRGPSPPVQRAGHDRRTALPGDDLLPQARAEITHHVDIASPPELVWPWLVQMGRGRGGWYSWDLLDNGGARSAERIIPALQKLAVGDVLPIRSTGPEGSPCSPSIPRARSSSAIRRSCRDARRPTRMDRARPGRSRSSPSALPRGSTPGCASRTSRVSRRRSCGRSCL
jgi:hypothetical protein